MNWRWAGENRRASSLLSATIRHKSLAVMFTLRLSSRMYATCQEQTERLPFVYRMREQRSILAPFFARTSAVSFSRQNRLS